MKLITISLNYDTAVFLLKLLNVTNSWTIDSVSRTRITNIKSKLTTAINKAVDNAN